MDPRHLHMFLKMRDMNMGFIYGVRGVRRRRACHFARQPSTIAIQDVCPDAKPQGLDDVHLAVVGSLEVERQPLASRGFERSSYRT